MKKIICAVALLLISFAGHAQSITPANPLEYNFPLATATGVVSGGYLVLDTAGGPVANFSIDAYATGTIPSVCTFEVQTSPDGLVWNTGADTPTGDISCASATDKFYSIVSKPARYLRINIGTLTGADGTTRIKFFYTRVAK